MPKILAVLFAPALALAIAGCGNDNPTPPASSASASATTAVPESKTLAHLVIDSSGSATFDMKAPQENIKGVVRGFGGNLDVELADLTKSRGKITVDVTTLETHTFGEEKKDETQSEHARTWMEVGTKTSEDKRQKFKLAEFVIKEIVNPSAADVTAMTGDSRSVTLTAKGDFTLHGRSTAMALDLACAFRFDGGALKSVVVKSAKPALVNLKAHDIQARDDVGEVVIAKTLELFGTKVADDASVTFEVVAKPKGAKDTPAPTPAVSSATAASSAPAASGAPSAAPSAPPKGAP